MAVDFFTVDLDDEALALERRELAVRLLLAALLLAVRLLDLDEAVRDLLARLRAERLLAAFELRDAWRDSRYVGWFQPTALSARNWRGMSSTSP